MQLSQIKSHFKFNLAKAWQARDLTGRSLDVVSRGILYFIATLFIFCLAAACVFYFLPQYVPGYPVSLLLGGTVFLSLIYTILFGIVTLRFLDNSSFSYRLDLMATDIERLEHNTSADYKDLLEQHIEAFMVRLEQTEKACPFSDFEKQADK